MFLSQILILRLFSDINYGKIYFQLSLSYNSMQNKVIYLQLYDI